MKILITDFSSYKAIVIAKFIKRYYPSSEIISVDHRRFTSRIRSKYSDEHYIVESSGIDAPDYPEKLASLVAANDIDWLIPINSQEIGGLLEKRKLFGSTLDYWGSAIIYKTLHDKSLLHAELKKLGVPIPVEYDCLSSAIAPIVIKPTNASASKGVRYLTTADDIQKYRVQHGDTLAGHVIQAFVEGEGAGYSGFFNEGKIVAAYGHIRLGEFPISGGSSVYRGPLPSQYKEGIKSIVETILKKLPWSGFAMFEFKVSADGNIVFIECNPRIWGSINQGLANGTNYFVKLLGPPEVEVNTDTDTVLTYFSPLFWASLCGYIVTGRFAKVGIFIQNCFRSKVDVSFIKDPIGFLSLIGRIVKS